jgi:hypothetical protein
MKLVEPNEGPEIPGISIPAEFYWVILAPHPLAGMPYPRWDLPWTSLADAGFGAVLSLEPGAFDPSPLVRLDPIALQDLVRGGDPIDPVKEKQRVTQASSAVVATLNSGMGVVVHCAGGRGRTGTVIGCALRQFGHGPDEVVDYLDRLHRARGRQGGWPESPWQAALVRSFGGTA